jgi:hypothetical protein
MGDLKHSEELFYGLARKHSEESVYFQEVAPLDVDLKIPSSDSKLYNYWRFFQKNGDAIEKIEPPKTGEERKRSISYYNMSVGSSSSPWIDPIQTPIYVFGHRNRAFVNYISKISENSDIKRVLNLMGWVDTQEDDLFTENVFKDENDNQTRTSPRKNLTRLEKFTKGSPVEDNILTGHPFIPIIRHPDAPKFRWCFAEMAIVPTKRSLNVLFFETGDEDKKEEEK